MKFPFAIRKLKKILTNEQTIAARGADRFAAKRIVELKEAIEILEKPKAESIKPKVVQTHKPKTQLNLFT